jgi:hypothetical protein
MNLAASEARGDSRIGEPPLPEGCSKDLRDVVADIQKNYQISCSRLADIFKKVSFDEVIHYDLVSLD